MTYRLGHRSLDNLEGVHPDLVKVVKRAIELTSCDFAVIEGVRPILRQAELIKAGASKTMNSRHLTGHAVDLAAYLDGDIRWDWPLYCKIAHAMKLAADELGVKIRWGGVWDKLMPEYGGSSEMMKREVEAYCTRHKGNDFIDGPHFELSAKEYPT